MTDVSLTVKSFLKDDTINTGRMSLREASQRNLIIYLVIERAR